MANELSQELKDCLKTITIYFEKEDIFVRERQLRNWKRLKFLWEGFQHIWWSETAHDWRVWDLQTEADSTDQSYYDKPINVFRAYLESIIAALSATVPPITCAPDDAENPLDISTAKAGNKITELVYKHNDAPLLWVHALFIYCTEGMITARNYSDYNEKYGTYEEDKYDKVEEEEEVKICPMCNERLSDEPLAALELDEFAPDDNDVPIKDALARGMMYCDVCSQVVNPELDKRKFIVSRLVGKINKPKARQCIKVYGGLNVKIATYASEVCQTPYLRFAEEIHWTKACEKYPQLWDDKTKSWRVGPGENSGGYDDYEKWARLSPQYGGDFPTDVVTERMYWLQPMAFNYIDDEEKRNALRRRFPDGCCVIYVNDEYVESYNAALEDEWTIGKNPLSDFLQYNPAGSLLTSVQEITNTLVSLTLQTIEHGIPQTFADPSIVDFEAYRNSEALVGGIYPTKQISGKKIGDGFHEVKTAMLSGEVMPFGEKIQQMGQMVSGALPSLFGGDQNTGSKTAAEYSMSRQQALQRLQNTWKMLNFWWKDIFAKVIPAYIKCVKEDEKHVTKDQMGNYINVFVRKAEIQGKIGDIECEASDQLPLTWAQKKDVIEKIMQSNNEEMMAALSLPENAPLVASAIGLTDFILPDNDDRLKQLEEIHLLLQSEPVPSVGMLGQPELQPSVPVDPLLDNHAVEAEITRRWLIGEVGRQIKVDNSVGYQNVLLHLKMHMQVMAQAQMAQQQQIAQQEQMAQPPAAQNKTEPRQGNESVH